MKLNLTHLTQRNRVRVAVEGTIPNADGTGREPFRFTLQCKRLPPDVMQSKLSSGISIIDLLLDVVEGWSDLEVDDGQPWPYSADNLRALCEQPGMASILLDAYGAQQGARAKN